MIGTIGNYSANYYKTYSFNSSDKYTNNAVDASKISKERFNVSNLTNALDSMGKGLSNNFPVVTSVDLYAKTMYKMSQFSKYEDINKNLDHNIMNFLTPSTNLSGMYKIIGRSSEISVDYVKNLIKEKGDDNNTVNKYNDYLSQEKIGSILDILI